MKCNTNKCSRFPVRKACLLAPCPFCSEPKPVPTPLNAPGNLRAMLPTINCPTHPYSKDFLERPTFTPRSILLFPRIRLNLEWKTALGLSCSFPITERLSSSYVVGKSLQMAKSLYPSMSQAKEYAITSSKEPLWSRLLPGKTLGLLYHLTCRNIVPIICCYIINHINWHAIIITTVSCSQIL